ncbi:MAG: TnpV protein [Eubacteriales bacterium]|nr:TnpV protein [Eubacteriales bacterium]
MQGDYYIPCLTLQEEKNKSISIWGQRHKEFLKEHRKSTYTTMLIEGKMDNIRACAMEIVNEEIIYN